jgi:glycosyltransferase involved in cell wall biosynthesis
MEQNTKKTIGINTLFMIPNKVGGTEYHLRSFLKYLEELDTKNKYLVFCNKENYDTFTFKSKNWLKVLCPVNAENRIVRILYEQLALPFLIRKQKCDIIHSYGYFGPLFTPGVKQIITVHDTNWKDHPEDNSVLSNFVMKLLTESNIRTADLIATDSEFGKSRLTHYFPQYKDKIKVIEPGLEDDFLKLLKTNNSHPLNGKQYVLSVSAFYSHKNIPYLLELWRELSKNYKDLHLVLIGRNGKDERKVIKMLETLERVEYYPKVSYIQLVAFYKHAELFIHASKYEGFGYPVYEAVAAKTKLILGNLELYNQSVTRTSSELTFDITQDLQIVSKVFKSENKTKLESNSNYIFSTDRLIKFYNNI